MEMVEEASIATVCDAAAMAELRQGPLRPWLGRRSGRQATIGMDDADERSGRLSEMSQVCPRSKWNEPYRLRGFACVAVVNAPRPSGGRAGKWELN